MNWWRKKGFALGFIPFIILVIGYSFFSSSRLAVNPDDKLTPAMPNIGKAFYTMAFIADERKSEPFTCQGGRAECTYKKALYILGNAPLWGDTYTSLKRLLSGLLCGAFVGLCFGIVMGLFPTINKLMQPFTRFVAVIPPLAILPILFIIFGVGELGKFMLIYIGTTFIITLDMLQAIDKMPRQEFVKARTLGASTYELARHVVFPQIIPRLIDTIRVNLGPAWLFLIAAEAIASTEGLGYRIFLVRRYLAMDIIIPYVIWITLIGFIMSVTLNRIVNRYYGWYRATS